MKNGFKKQWIWVIGIGIVLIFSLPFLDIFLNWGWNLPEKFEPNEKDFYTIWFTLFGAIGAGLTIWQTQTQAKDNRFVNNFVKSVELLESKSESTRIGGIYGLCFLAKEYVEDYKNYVFEILCGHIRSKTAEKEYRNTHTDMPSSEIRTLLNLLLRKDLELSKDNKLFKGFKNAYLERCYLRNAYLPKAHLQKAKFTEADLQGANFSEAYLQKAKFCAAHLEGADFEKAHLEGADFKDANLKEANFKNANLKGAKFEKAHYLECLKFEGAKYNKGTTFPKGFDPSKYGMIQIKNWLSRAIDEF